MTWKKRYEIKKNCCQLCEHPFTPGEHNCPFDCDACGEEICPICGRELTVDIYDSDGDVINDNHNCECGWEHCMGCFE